MAGQGHFRGLRPRKTCASRLTRTGRVGDCGWQCHAVVCSYCAPEAITMPIVRSPSWPDPCCCRAWPIQRWPCVRVRAPASVGHVSGVLLRQGSGMSLRQLVNSVRRYGACVTSSNADAWFREEPRGPAALELQRRYARQACAECPVRAECLMVALSYEDESRASWGIWGGVCARDRQETIQRARQGDPDGDLDVAGLAERLLSMTIPKLVSTTRRSASENTTVDRRCSEPEQERIAS